MDSEPSVDLEQLESQKQREQRLQRKKWPGSELTVEVFRQICWKSTDLLELIGLVLLVDLGSSSLCSACLIPDRLVFNQQFSPGMRKNAVYKLLCGFKH